MSKEWTEGRLRGFIVSLLRSGMRKYPPKWEIMGKAYVGIKQNQATGRKAKHFECNGCGGHFPQKDVNVDHIESVTSVYEGFVDWDTYINRMFCKADNLQVLCKDCHSTKSTAERKIREQMKDERYEKTYRCWSDMKQRCYNQNSQRYHTHGGRGIQVCDSWRHSFETFLDDMGLKPDGYTLERKDNEMGYSKDNCKWATPQEQALNRRTNRYITWDDKTLTISQWAEIFGFSHKSMSKRIDKWPLEKAMSSIRYEADEVTDEVKEEILFRYQNENISQKKLAEEYGISQSVISKWNVKENAL